MTIDIRLASAADAVGIATMLQPNTAAHGGALYGDWSLGVIERWLATGSPIVVACEHGALTGVLFSAEKSQASAPPVVAMLAAYPGQQDAYVYGPVCVDASMRGKGILEKLVVRMEAAVSEPFPLPDQFVITVAGGQWLSKKKESHDMTDFMHVTSTSAGITLPRLLELPGLGTPPRFFCPFFLVLEHCHPYHRAFRLSS